MPLPNFNRRSPQPQLLTNSFDGWRCNVSPCVAACGGNIEGTVRRTERVQSNAAKRLFCKLGDRKACETATLFLIKPLRSCAPPPHPRSARQRKTLLHRDTRNNKKSGNHVINPQPSTATGECCVFPTSQFSQP